MIITKDTEELLYKSIMIQKERSVMDTPTKDLYKEVEKKDAEGKPIPVFDKDGNRVVGKWEMEKKFDKTVIIEDLNNPRYVVMRIAKYLNYFSSLGEFDYQALDVDLDKIPIPNELVDFIDAATYRLDPSNFLSKDQKKASNYSKISDDGLSISEWYQLLYALRSFKKVTSLKNMTTLDQLKKNVSYYDVEARLVVNKNVHYEDVVFVPVELDYTLAKASYDANYFTHKSSDILERYISMMKWTSNRD